MKKKLKISVLGLGYVGLPSALIISESKHFVTGVDNDENVINDLNKNIIKIKEGKIQSLFYKLKKNKKIKFSKSPLKSDVFIICVPTPLKKNKADLSLLNNAIESLFPVLVNNNTIIIESTCPVGTTLSIKKKIDKYFKYKLKYKLAYCPERVLPGNIYYEILNNDKIVGGVDESSTKFVKDFFSGVINGNIHTTNSNTAELCKLVENSYRDLNIAFANQISILCAKNNINTNHLINLANKHTRVNILNPSIGVGGHCIPIDPVFLIELDRKNSSLIAQSRLVNLNKTKWVISNLYNDLNNLMNHKKSIKILCLGLAYKPNVGDIRESPAYKIFEKLKKDKKFDVYAYDPYVVEKKSFILKDLENIRAFEVIIKLVDHNLFNQLRFKKLFKNKKTIDLSQS